LIEQLNAWLKVLCSLHDVKITSLNWDTTRGTLTIDLDDVYAYHRDWPGRPPPQPDAPGTTPGRVIFQGVQSVEAEFSPLDELWIYEFLPSQLPDDRFEVEIRFSPGGLLKVVLDGTITYEPAQLYTGWTT
jgi:hypothetical protein